MKDFKDINILKKSDNFNERNSNAIDLSWFENKSFKDKETLNFEVNMWSIKQKFLCRFDTGERTRTKDNIKYCTLVCQEANRNGHNKEEGCQFYLRFEADLNCIIENGCYILKSSNNMHNHQLNAKPNYKLVNPDIKNEITKCIGKVKNNGSLADIINHEGEIIFSTTTISYQVKKVEETLNGSPTEDAQKLIDKFEFDKVQRRSYYEYIADDKNRLQKAFYMSCRMKKLLQSFSDIIIIDGTYKKNRFGMTVVDGAVINNLGQSCICFFSLIENNTEESYQWIMSQIKRAMGNSFSPIVIFTDCEDALINGN